MSNNNIRVRFAPSPTGYMHIGNLRTALYNWLFARSTDGTFILRIEDTDRQRHSDDAIRVIIDGLKRLNLDFDEGPFFQSERLSIYNGYAEELLEKGVAFRSDRGAKDKGEAVVLRRPMEDVEFIDEIKGGIVVSAEELQDLVIIKSDGFPTYNFACAIDDHEMGITHVLRGDDHLSNVPKQLEVYRSLGWQPPKFAHLPMILGPDGQRLSKRHGAVKVTEFLEQGYLPHVILNYIALLGWSPGDDTEIMTIEEMVKSFKLKRVRPNAARFDYEKFSWMNGAYIRNTPASDLYEPVMKILEEEGIAEDVPSRVWLIDCIELYHERMKTLCEFVQSIRFFFANDDEIRFRPIAVKKVLKKPSALPVLEAAKEELSAIQDFEVSMIESALRSICEKLEYGFGKVAQPVRVAITGTNVSSEIFKTIELLGREATVSRIERTITLIKLNEIPLSEE